MHPDASAFMAAKALAQSLLREGLGQEVRATPVATPAMDDAGARQSGYLILLCIPQAKNWKECKWHCVKPC